MASEFPSIVTAGLSQPHDNSDDSPPPPPPPQEEEVLEEQAQGISASAGPATSNENVGANAVAASAAPAPSPTPVVAPAAAAASSIPAAASSSSSSSSSFSSAAPAPLSPSPNANPSGPSVLILGGCGFIGRHLVAYLSSRRLCSRITIADKSLAATSNLNAEHKAFYDDKALVIAKHADVSKPDHVARIFKDTKYDYVFNLCGETRFGQSEKDYQLKCVETADRCAKAAAEHGVKKFIEVSTAQVYKSDKSASTETAPLKPWTMQATKRLEAEQRVQKTPNLPWVILRPAIVYGTGDLTGLTPRMSCAAVYHANGEKMRFLWGEDLRINVVHADDVAAAMWVAATECAPGSIYNLADQSDLTQGKLNPWIASLFKIETSFLGSLVSNLARLNLSGVASEANDKHVPAFTQICHKQKILNSPLTPYIDQELLKDNHLSVDGNKITKDTSFKYTKQASMETVREQIDSFIQQGVFPPLP